MELNSILDKVHFLLESAKNRADDITTITIIEELANEHTDNIIIGRFLEYSVSDYAIATLKWIGTARTEQLFCEKYEQLSERRKNDVEDLIKRKLYLEL